MLDRVKLFLPMIEKANKELVEGIASGKVQARIDDNLDEIHEDDGDEEEDDDGDDNDDDITDTANTSEKSTDDRNYSQQSSTSQQVVKLEFMCGDFDGSIIAEMEEKADTS